MIQKIRGRYDESATLKLNPDGTLIAKTELAFPHPMLTGTFDTDELWPPPAPPIRHDDKEERMAMKQILYRFARVLAAVVYVAALLLALVALVAREVDALFGLSIAIMVAATVLFAAVVTYLSFSVFGGGRPARELRVAMRSWFAKGRPSDIGLVGAAFAVGLVFLIVGTIGWQQRAELVARGSGYFVSYSDGRMVEISRAAFDWYHVAGSVLVPMGGAMLLCAYLWLVVSALAVADQRERAGLRPDLDSVIKG